MANLALHRVYTLLLSLLIVSALAVHIWFAIFSNTDLVGDMRAYHDIMIHMILHGYYGIGASPGAYVTPAYPFFLALVFFIWRLFDGVAAPAHGDFVRIVYSLQQLITLGIPFFSFLIAKELSNRWAGLVAGFLGVAYLPNNYIGSEMLTEAIYIPLLLLCLLYAIQCYAKPTLWRLVGLGLLMGLAVLTRPTAVAMILVFATLLVLPRPGRGEGHASRSVWLHTALFVGSFLLIMAPWWIRNALSLHRFVPFSTEGGNPLLLGASPYFRIGQYSLLAMARDAHLPLETYSLQYIWHGFSMHFWVYLGWYTIGRIPYYFYSPWLLWGIADSAAFVYFHRLLVITGFLASIFCLMKPTLRAAGFLTLSLLLIQWPFLPIERYVYPVIVLWSALIPAIVANYLQYYKNTITKISYIKNDYSHPT